MCGIAGIVNRDAEQPVRGDVVARMCSVIRHRGPDDEGVWHKGAVGIGMRRLSIIDVAGGHQPIHNEDKTVWIVFNGEIYNHLDLRRDLEARGHRYYTQSDTETIVHLYEEHGDACVDHLRGMFSFAIWDERRRQLFIARDRLGIKPLHYYHDGDRFVFGSEIKSLLAANIPRRIHYPSLVNYYAYGYVPDPDCFFDGVQKLPPGHTLVYRDGSFTVRRYWDVSYDSSGSLDEEEYVDRILDTLSEAVRIRLMSEVPLGAFLSGGTDSSVVVALMARHMGEPVKTFSIGFEHAQYNELDYARAVARHFETDHHEEIVDPDVEAILPDLVDQLDEPFADSSAIPTYYVSRMARRHVTVALSGDGGDELFAGYLRYLDPPRERLAAFLPPRWRDPLVLGLADRLPDGYPGVNFLRNLSGNSDQQFLRRVSKGITSAHTGIFSPHVCGMVPTTDPASPMRRYLQRAAAYDVLSRRQYLDTKSYLPGDILTKVDRMSMLVSLEARVPILDHHVVELAARVPAALRLKNGTTKYIFKKVAERLMPSRLVNRPKKGFAIPIRFWLKKEWSEMSEELVLGERALSRGNFDERYLRRIVSEHRTGRRDNSAHIWTLMMLEMWFRDKMDSHPVGTG